MKRKKSLLVCFIALFSAYSCKKCVQCSYENNFGDRVDLQEYCGKKKVIESYKEAYKDYKNFNCEEIK